MDYKIKKRWVRLSNLSILVFMDRIVSGNNPAAKPAARETSEGLDLYPSKNGVKEWDGENIVLPYSEWQGYGPRAVAETRYAVFDRETLAAAFDRVTAKTRNRWEVLGGRKHEAPSHEVSLGGHHE